MPQDEGEEEGLQDSGDESASDSDQLGYENGDKASNAEGSAGLVDTASADDRIELSVEEQRDGGQQTAVSGETLVDVSVAEVEAKGLVRNFVPGMEVKPSISLCINGLSLQEGTDYILMYDGSPDVPVAVGVYKVVAQGVEGGGFTGKCEVGEFVLCDAIVDSSKEYWLASAADPSLVLDAAGSRPASGSNASVYSQHGGSNQLWTLELGEDGYYVIRSAADPSLVLDAAGSRPASGSNVSVWKGNGGGLNQRWVVSSGEDGCLMIRSAADPSLVLDAAGSRPASGSNVSVWADNGGGLNQRWVLKDFGSAYEELDTLAKQNASLIPDGSYTFYSALEGHPVVDVAGGSLDANANIQTATSRANKSQLWVITHDNKGYVLLKNANSGKYLGVENSLATSGANVVQVDEANNRNAKWIFVNNADGTYSVRSALFVGLSLDVYRGSSAAGTDVEIFSTNDAPAQRFSLVATPAHVDRCDPVIDDDGYYFIRPTSEDSLQLDVAGASLDNGAKIDLWSNLNMMHQMFRFEYVDGYYQIVSAASEKALDVDGSSLVPHSGVILYDGAATDNQLWSVIQNSDGSYSFISKKNGLLLSVCGSVSQGASIDTDLASSSDRQSFELVKVTDMMPTGLYKFSSALNSSMVLDVASASKNDAAKIEIWSNNTGFAQKWWIQKVEDEDNTYTLQAVCSGKYLKDNDGTLSQTNEVTESSKWNALIKDGKYALVNVATERALDVSNSSTSSGALVQTWSYHGGANQLWNLTKTAPISSGTYIIRSLVDSNQVVDVPNSSMVDGAVVDMWGYHGGGNQKYKIYQNSDGTYTITNCLSGKALDANKGSSAVGTNIIQYKKTNTVNQRWNVVYAGDGGFKLVSAMDPSVVIGFGASPANGAQLVLEADKGESIQHFTFEATTYVPPLPADQQAMLDRIRWTSSGSQWLIAVDRSSHKVGVFKGGAGNWSIQYYWSCVTGASVSPTITGTYRTTGYKKPRLSTDRRAVHCTQIYGGYFFHSILVSESELGHSLSHGCIRLHWNNALWIYNNIPGGTTVVIYN